MRTWQWITVVVVALVALLVGAVVGSFVFGGYGMMNGYRGLGPGMMRGFSIAPFGWILMLLMMAFPLGILVLIVLGVVWLVGAVSRSGQQPVAIQQPVPVPAAVKTCPNCQRPVQADWRNCPYCGAPLT